MNANTTILPPLEPDYCSPPGETIQYVLEDLNMTQKELATRTGLTAKCINEIIRGKAVLTPDVAARIERATCISATLLLNMERLYREWLDIDSRAKDPVVRIRTHEFLKDFPYTDLVRRGECRYYREPHYRESEILRFFGVVGEEEYESTYGEIAGAARVGYSRSWNSKAFAAWLRLGERAVTQQSADEYDASVLREAIMNIRGLVRFNPGEVWQTVEKELNRAGVVVAVVPELKDVHAAGFCRWFPGGRRALVQLSLRGNRADIFWFNLLHELAHVLQRKTKKRFVNSGNDNESKSVDEAQDPDEVSANQQARDWLIPLPLWEKFTSMRKKYPKASILDFARQVGVSADFVVGRLQKEKRVPHYLFKDLLRPLEEKFFLKDDLTM